jgi:hypothetical protein
VYCALLLALAPSGFAIAVAAINLLICLYLYRNVKRLAAEARALPGKT